MFELDPRNRPTLFWLSSAFYCPHFEFRYESTLLITEPTDNATVHEVSTEGLESAESLAQTCLSTSELEHAWLDRIEPVDDLVATFGTWLKSIEYLPLSEPFANLVR